MNLNPCADGICIHQPNPCPHGTSRPACPVHERQGYETCVCPVECVDGRDPEEIEQYPCFEDGCPACPEHRPNAKCGRCGDEAVKVGPKPYLCFECGLIESDDPITLAKQVHEAMLERAAEIVLADGGPMITRNEDGSATIHLVEWRERIAAVIRGAR